MGELARAFNTMAAQLADVDRERRDLVANVSHELRTPIGALQALLENLADGVEPPDPRTLRIALAQTERLGRLVAQLLDLSRMESGAQPLAPVPFAVRPLLERALQECALGDHGTVRLRVSVQPGDLAAHGDPERVHQVVANLLDNAVRHSPDDGRVWLSAHATDGGAVRIAVDDEGAGIPPRRGRAGLRALLPDGRRRARRATAAPAWGWRSRGRSPTRTAGRCAPSTARPRGCRMVLELPR